jgi:hypothetical protein
MECIGGSSLRIAILGDAVLPHKTRHSGHPTSALGPRSSQKRCEGKVTHVKRNVVPILDNLGFDRYGTHKHDNYGGTLAHCAANGTA